jgi:hypothetical protein
MIKLTQVFNQFDACLRCKEEQNPLRHILGGGEFSNPKFLFLFINPTHQNISSHPEYQGKRRYPFLGVRHFWKLFSEAGIVEKDIVTDIYSRGWQTEHEDQIEENLCERKIYITNLVKCTQPHPDNPSKEVIYQDFDLLQEEINLVNPRYIVTFGKLPTQIITGKDMRLSDRLVEVQQDNYKPISSLELQGKSFNVLPCYFPVGRGNPPKAKEILRYIMNNFS